MGAPRRIGLVAVWFGTLGLAACQQGPESPTQPTANREYAPLEVRCSADVTLTCTVERFGEGDLTAQAEWFATDVMWGTVPDPGVTFTRPGVPVATRPVRLYIGARVGTETDRSSYSYEMAPGARAVQLAALLGFVYQGETGNSGLGDARVEIVEGEGSTGLSATTTANGSYTIFHVRVGVPLRIRGSKAGYEPSVATHQGIKPHPLGFPDAESIFQHFWLKQPSR